MNWDDLRIVIAVSRATSFARAARDLGVDETTVARRLARLEGALGVTLFDAVDGARVPTVQGRAILRHANDLERAAQAALACAHSNRTPARHLRLAATASVAEHILAPGIATLLNANPGLHLTLKTGNENADLSRWEADLAIRLGRPAKGNFTMRKLGELRYVLLRPAGNAGSDLPICAYPDDLLDSPEMRALARHFPDATPRLKTGNLGVMRAYLASGRAAGILPNYLVADMPKDPGIDVTELSVRREAWLLMQSHLKGDATTRKVADWVIARFAVATA